MSVVNTLDRVTEWVQTNICDGIKLKMPPEDENAPTDAGYEYKLITPTAFPLFVPSKDKLPPGVLSPLPSVCVRFMEGEETLSQREGSIGLQLVFCTWSTGQHSKDVLDGSADGFKRNADGWRDAWDFVDIALRKLGNSLTVGGFELDRSTPIKYGPLTEQGEIIEAYPLWFAWVSFSIKFPVLRYAEEIEKDL